MSLISRGLVVFLTSVLVMCSVVAVRGQEVQRISAHSALLEVVRRVPISTEVAGRIVSVTPSDEGVLVKAGDEMIRLDDAVIQAEVKRAKVELDLQTEIEFAKVSLEVAKAEEQQKREANQRRPGAFNPSEIRQVELEVKKGDASLRKAVDDKLIQEADLQIKQAQLAQYTVKAPFDGLVAQGKGPASVRRMLFVGDQVEIRVGEAKAVESVREAPGRRPGGSLFDGEGAASGARASDPAEFAAAEVQVGESEDSVFLGEIRFIDPVLDNISGTPMTKLSVFVPNRQDQYGRYLLYQGMPVTATVLAKARN